MYTAKAQGRYWTVVVHDMHDSPIDASRLACEAVRYFDEVHPNEEDESGAMFMKTASFFTISQCDRI